MCAVAAIGSGLRLDIKWNVISVGKCCIPFLVCSMSVYLFYCYFRLVFFSPLTVALSCFNKITISTDFDSAYYRCHLACGATAAGVRKPAFWLDNCCCNWQLLPQFGSKSLESHFCSIPVVNFLPISNISERINVILNTTGMTMLRYTVRIALPWPVNDWGGRRGTKKALWGSHKWANPHVVMDLNNLLCVYSPIILNQSVTQHWHFVASGAFPEI